MSACVSCKHWTPPAERDDFRTAVSFHYGDKPYQPGLVDKTDMLYGECRAIIIQIEWDPDEPVPLATTRDASDYKATLYTQSTFGCRMHEEKTDEPV